jgi:hypothetical protein
MASMLCVGYIWRTSNLRARLPERVAGQLIRVNRARLKPDIIGAALSLKSWDEMGGAINWRRERIPPMALQVLRPTATVKASYIRIFKVTNTIRSYASR